MIFHKILKNHLKDKRIKYINSHTKNISSHSLKERMYLESTIPSNRQAILKRLLETKKICRFLEAHSPLSAIIAEQVFYKDKHGKKIEFEVSVSSIALYIVSN